MTRADQQYRSRIVDSELQDRLRSAGAVVLEGPRASGKTRTARRAAASEVLLDVDSSARAAVAVDPSLVLDGPVPRLIDEWQLEPELWNHVRRAIDDRGTPGQFILTGSAIPADAVTRHTGAGRLSRIRMRPLSLFESGHSTGAVSLAQLVAGEKVRSTETALTVADLAERVAVGGWPGFQTLPADAAVRAVASYLDEIRRTDIGRVDDTRRDPRRVARLLRAVGRNVATAVAVTTLAADTAGDDAALTRDTIYDYLAALERLMIVEDQPAWAPHLRSRARLRAAAKRHFADPSLAVAALGASPAQLARDLNFLGLLFESLAIRDLRVYAQACDATVLHYADHSGLEVDAVVELRDGRWGAFEIKLGGALVDDGARSLLKFADKVDRTRAGDPFVLAVISGTGYGFVRDDGVAVIPIGSLGP